MINAVFTITSSDFKSSRAGITRRLPLPRTGSKSSNSPSNRNQCRSRRSRRSFPRISPRRKPPNSRAPRPRDRKPREFRRSKPLRILSLILPYLPHFVLRSDKGSKVELWSDSAHVAEEKKLYSSYAYRTHNLPIKTDVVFLDEARFSRTPQDTLSLFSHSHFHIFPGLRALSSCGPKKNFL